MKILLIPFFLVLVFSISGQTKRTVKPPKPPVIEIAATTVDGKSVILSSDGSWRYNTDTKITPTKVSEQATSGKLNIEAALIYKSGDIKPVARIDFYLLPTKAEDIVGTPELIALYKQDAISKGYGSTMSDASAGSLIGALYKYQLLYPSYSTAASGLISKAAKYKITTDFSGKGVFENIPLGTYHLFGFAPTQKSFAYWSLPVEINGIGNLVLDQNNAAQAY